MKSTQGGGSVPQRCSDLQSFPDVKVSVAESYRTIRLLLETIEWKLRDNKTNLKNITDALEHELDMTSGHTLNS